MIGAVVEIQFELLHYPISATQKHSFNVIVQQIQILQRGEDRPPTAFKRKTIEEGLIQVDEGSTSSEEDETEQPLTKRPKGKTESYITSAVLALAWPGSQGFGLAFLGFGFTKP